MLGAVGCAKVTASWAMIARAMTTSEPSVSTALKRHGLVKGKGKCCGVRAMLLWPLHVNDAMVMRTRELSANDDTTASVVS